MTDHPADAPELDLAAIRSAFPPGYSPETDQVLALVDAYTAQGDRLARAQREVELINDSYNKAEVEHARLQADLAAAHDRLAEMERGLAAARRRAEDAERDIDKARAEAAAQRARAEELERVINRIAALHISIVHTGSCMNHGLAMGRILIAAGFGLPKAALAAPPEQE